MMNQAKYPEYQVGRVDIAVEQCVSDHVGVSRVTIKLYKKTLFDLNTSGDAPIDT